MRENDNKRRFVFSIKGIVWCGIAFFLAILLYAACLHNIAAGKQNILFQVFRDVALVICSLFAGSLLSCLIIEKRELNDMYEDVLKGIISAPTVYKKLPKDCKATMHAQLLDDIYGIHNETQKNAIEFGICGIKTCFQNSSYYMKPYNITTTCTFLDGKFQKTVEKQMNVFSVNGAQRLKHFEILTHTCYADEQFDESVQIIKLTVNGVPARYSIDISKDVDFLEEKCGYNLKTVCYLTDDISIFEDHPTKIVLFYKTLLNVFDCSFASRVCAPCNGATFRFSIDPSVASKYYLAAFGFGTLDSANKTPNDDSEIQVSLAFEKWVFPPDGVIFVLNPKNSS